MEIITMSLIVTELPEIESAERTQAIHPPEPIQFDDGSEEIHTTADDGRPHVPLPGPGRTISEFAADVGGIIGPKHIWFLKGQQVVELRRVQINKQVNSIL